MKSKFIRIVFLCLVITIPLAYVGLRSVSAQAVQYQLYGVDFGPFIGESQNPNSGDIVTRDQLVSEFKSIGPFVERVRTYGCDTGLAEVPSVAQQYGIRVALGIWLGSNASSNDAQIVCAIDAVHKNRNIDTVIVGSEALLRKDLTGKQLIAYISQVRNLIPGVLIVTADVPESFLNNEDVVDAIDQIWVNYFPYWAGVDTKNAIAWVESVHKQMLTLAAHHGNKRIVVSETGWPSQGATIGNAIPNLANAAQYFVSFVTWARRYNVPYYYFEAFDEPWKGTLNAPQEAFWGIWDSTGTMKTGLANVFAGKLDATVWNLTQEVTPVAPVAVTTTPVPSGPPSISFTKVPPMGSYDRLQGRVDNVNPSDYKVAVYIQVGGGWWTKPYFNAPLTTIKSDGTWNCSIVTGGNDANATSIIAYLVPANFDPPLASGNSLDPSLSQYPHVQADR